jgi:hypothetical protein
MFFCLTRIQETALIRADGMIENTKALSLHTIVKGKGTILSSVPVPFIPNDKYICPASNLLNLLHITKERHGVKSRLFVDWDMRTLLEEYNARYLLKNLLSDLGFSEDKTPYSFKYVALSYLVVQITLPTYLNFFDPFIKISLNNHETSLSKKVVTPIAILIHIHPIEEYIRRISNKKLT